MTDDPFHIRDEQTEYADKVDRILKSKTGLVLPRFGFTPENVQGGLLWIVLIPVWIVLLVLADLVRGWRRWRVLGVLFGIVIAGLALAGGIFAEVVSPTLLDSVGERFGTTREDTMIGIIAGGIACSLMFCFPRTTLVLIVLVALEQAYKFFF